MIFYHICIFCGIEYFVINRYLFFFMPWFFFKAGMLSIERPSHEELKKTFFRLIIPFILFSFIGWLINSWNLYLSGDDNLRHFFVAPIKQFINDGSIDGNKPLWFLLSLFLIRNINALINNINHNLLLYILLVIISLIICFYNVHPLWISNTSCGLLFYISGKKMKQLQYEKWAIILMVCLYLIPVFFIPSIVDMRTNITQKGYYSIWILSSIAGCVCANNLFKKIKNIRVLEYIGKNSIVFFVCHWLILVLVKILYIQLLGYNDKIILFNLMVMSCFFILPIATILYNEKFKMQIWNS